MKKRTDNFDKFANKKKGSAVKEAYRQEKKKVKLEARAAGEEMRKKKIDKLRGIDTAKEDKLQAARFKPIDKKSTRYEIRVKISQELGVWSLD